MEAGNGQPAPPARRVRVGWCPSRCVPASASVISPTPRGEAPREPRWPILSGEWRELGITGNVRRAAATASRWYWSLLKLPTPPLTNPREGSDRPLARNSPRRTPQVARSAVAPSCSRTTFCETWQSRKRGEKQRVPVHIWCLADCQKIRPTACPKCVRGESGVIIKDGEDHRGGATFSVQ
jgi:hypothetical protein